MRANRLIHLEYDGLTPLNSASTNGDADVVKALLAHGASVDVASNVET